MPLYSNINIADAARIQQELRHQVNTEEHILSINTIGGADISLNLYSTTVYAGIILLSFPELRPVSWSLVKAETRFPYVPGYLAFREVPALIQAWERLPVKPGVLVVDGHGIAHPRRMGIATHFGIETGQPTIGCAKKLLTGRFDPPAPETGSHRPILSRDEQIGHAFRSKRNVAPVFISPGHLMGMNNSLQVIRQCLGRYRIPEPTRLAHELVNRFRRGELEEGYASASG